MNCQKKEKKKIVISSTLPTLPNEIYNLIFQFVIKNNTWKLIQSRQQQVDFLNHLLYPSYRTVTFQQYHFFQYRLHFLPVNNNNNIL